jgi:hypothetical protein
VTPLLIISNGNSSYWDASPAKCRQFLLSAINLCIDPNVQFLIDLILAGNGQYMTNKEHKTPRLLMALHQ